jgi:murein DD-endopeptidase MepM/ murein hydrolase activator NlpD
MVNPVPGYKITTPYKREGKLWRLGYHTGIDYKAPQGTDVVAAVGGRVLYAGRLSPWGASYGSAIIVLHRDMTRAIYAHLNKILVVAGQQIETGQRIGKVGNTGNSTGAHLHFEVRNFDFKYGDDINPMPYVVPGEPDITPQATKEALGLNKPVKKAVKKSGKKLNG